MEARGSAKWATSGHTAWTDRTLARTANSALEVLEAVRAGGFLGLYGPRGRGRAAGWPLHVGRSSRGVGCEQVDLIHGGRGVHTEMSTATLEVADVAVLRLLEGRSGGCSLWVEGLAPHCAARSGGEELVLGVEAAIATSAGRLRRWSPLLRLRQSSVVGNTVAIDCWARVAQGLLSHERLRGAEMGRRVSFVASTHRLVGFNLSYHGETACQTSRLVL